VPWIVRLPLGTNASNTFSYAATQVGATGS
jgi:hypothetical protein